MRAPRRDWSEQDSATLRDMWLAGQTAVAIGIALGGRGEQAVRWKAGQMGLERRHMGRQPTYGLGNRVARKPLGAIRMTRKKPKAFFATSFPPVRFIDFDRLKQCHFIEGEPAGADTLMCGRPIEAGVYCAGHRAICILPEMPLGR